MTEEQKRIKELEEEVSRLKGLAYQDELTTLYNRHGFKEESAKFIDEVKGYLENPSRRENFLIKSLSLGIFDIDNFKKINDTYGHQAGDEILKQASKIIKEKVRGIDIVARWGGEEIIVGLVGSDENHAFEIFDDIRKKIEEKTKVTVSGGVASFTEGGDFDSLFKKADEALYKAKQTGKNKIVKASDL
ncbi:MAG: GGDEF domain-containing protein [Candidatus Azambacteria bacterium]|nr:GGDEF domain-containing protein [Candidatus Azambacteria bacterium]